MSRKRIILYGIFAIYQIGAFIFTVMVDGHMDLLGLLKYIPDFKFISFLGLVLIALDIAWYFKDRVADKRKHEELEKENLHLKTKLYDYEHHRSSKQA